VNPEAQDASTPERIIGDSTADAHGRRVALARGRALRYRAKGALRWEALHHQSGDNRYRVKADDSVRLMPLPEPGV
jgi:hypothetical protein